MAIRDSFKKGMLELMILKMLSIKDMYGYQISQSIYRASGETIEILEGSMYPTLYRLVETGMLSDYRVPSGKRQVRIYYHMEAPGRARYAEMLKEFQIFWDGLSGLLAWEPPAEEAHT